MPLSFGQALSVAGVGAVGNITSQLLANRANRKLAEYSYQQQRQMIAEQNEYNSPLQQMARYQEAGLNPALIYGSGQASAGNQSAIAKYEAPTMEAPEVGTSVAQALQMALAYRQANADIALKEEQAYSQRQLGLKYQQDYYQSQIETAVKSMQAGLRTPAGVWSADDLDQIRRGNRLKHYDLEIKGMQATQDLQAATAALRRLNAKEQAFIIDNLQPMELKIMQLRSEGMSIDNAIKEIDRDLLEAQRKVGMGSQVGQVLIGLLRAILGR